MVQDGKKGESLLELLVTVFLAVMLPFFVFWACLFFLKPKSKLYVPKLRVSVIISAKNEEKNLKILLPRLSGLEIIVVDDGSTDRTGEVAAEFGAKVIRTDGVGKAKAANQGAKYASGEILIFLDADTLVNQKVIEEILAPFSDPKVGAVIGILKPGRGFFKGFQELEYAFVGKQIQAHAELNIPSPFFFGAFLAVRRKAFPGFDPVIGEDLDLAIRIRNAGWKIAATQTPVETEIPKTFIGYLRQRIRWVQGGILCALKNRKPLYCTFLYLFWPIYGAFMLFANLWMFLKWFSPSWDYILSWTSLWFIPHMIMGLPQWGFPIHAVLGFLVGIFANLPIIFQACKKPKLLPYAFFYPFYGMFVMGTVLALSLITLPKVVKCIQSQW